LIQANQLEKYSWLCGTLPHFDNVFFDEDIDQGEHLPNDLDREQNLAYITETCKTANHNFSMGNR